MIPVKHTFVTLATVGLLSTQAYASEAQVETGMQPEQAVDTFTDTDLQALFEVADKPMQLAALSEQEMKETEGAWVWNTVAWTVGGGGLGTLTYLWTTPSAQWNWRDAGRAFGSGATAGFYNSMVPLRAFGSAGSDTLGVLGAASWYRW